MRQYRKSNSNENKNNDYTKEYRKKNECNKDKNNEYMKGYWKSNCNKDKNSDYMTILERKRLEHTQLQAVQNLISKFHAIVLEGPLYICSCCDQFWYKHSVSSPSKLRETNADIHKYLLNKTNVDNVEWLCRTCHNYLAKSNVPPSAVVNGMHFPPKPIFFYFNELVSITCS